MRLGWLANVLVYMLLHPQHILSFLSHLPPLSPPPHLPVGDDLHPHGLLVQQSLDGSQTHPQVVGVEHLELFDGLELVHVILRHLHQHNTTTCMYMSKCVHSGSPLSKDTPELNMF